MRQKLCIIFTQVSDLGSIYMNPKVNSYGYLKMNQTQHKLFAQEAFQSEWLPAF